ncbi:DNA-processing protein DprA [Peptococcaceae bacterium 1198_IL3148]
MTLNNRLYWLAWQLMLPGSGKTVWQIIDHFGGVEPAWHAGEKAFKGVPGIKSSTIESIIYQRRRINLEQEVTRLEKHGVAFITFDDDNYPIMLKEIFDPPPVLFVRGQLNSLAGTGVALVGSRKATAYGKTVAQRLAGELTVSGVNIISGMARGIDTAAHQGALAAGGYTIAVLGCGLDVVYPRENKALMYEIIEHGAVITEFPLGSAPEPWHFPARNRIISGLSQGVVVVEAADKSGALITADFALEQGKEVMAVPGSIYSNMSKGSHKLLKQGAKLVTEAADILEELGLEVLFDNIELASSHGLKLSVTEQQIYNILQGDPLHLEDILRQVELSSQDVMAALMFLEVKKLVKKLPGKMYVATK